MSKKKSLTKRFQLVPTESNDVKIYSIRDAKGNVFFTPKYFRNEDEARRYIHQLVNTPNEQNLINRYPEDYDLFYLGTYNEESGRINGIVPTHIVKALTLKDQNPKI